MAIDIRTELITPARAAEYLRANVDNYRRISKRRVTTYAEEMKAGKWQLNGEGIMFDETGKLKNGQHRLAAIIASGTPVMMTVITGVGEDVTIYDTGMNRNMGQIAQASGCGDTSSTEAAVATAFVGRFNGAPKGLVLGWLTEHWEELRRAYRISGANSSRNLSRRCPCLIAAYIALRGGAKSFDVESFFTVFNSGNTVGTEGYEPSPALVARRMIAEKYKGLTNDRRRVIEQAEIMTMAIRDFLKGKARQSGYQVREPLACMELIDKYRKEDGLE